MIVSEKGTNASCPLPSEGIVLVGGKVEEERIHGESVAEMPFVLGRRRRRVRIVNIAAALISLAMASLIADSSNINICFLRDRGYGIKLN